MQITICTIEIECKNTQNISYTKRIYIPYTKKINHQHQYQKKLHREGDDFSSRGKFAYIGRDFYRISLTIQQASILQDYQLLNN